MPAEELRQAIESMYRGWVGAIQKREFGWFERHLAEDYTCTAHPFENFFLKKAAFIEADKKIGKLNVEFVEVHARAFGNTVVSQLVLKVIEEALISDLGGELPTAAELGATVKGKTVVYVSAWRKQGAEWQCYDHHMIGPVN